MWCQCVKVVPLCQRCCSRLSNLSAMDATGEMNAHVSAGCATVNGQALGARKRGAKPKYKFRTAEEAIAHRYAS